MKINTLGTFPICTTTFKNKNSSNNIYLKNKSQSALNSLYKKNISFSGSFFSSVFLKHTNKNKNDTNVSEFAKSISEDMKNVIGVYRSPNNCKNIMSPEELAQILPDLKEENFISSKENQKSGIYYADLDYQSSFSSGKENIFQILDNAAIFANQYYAKHGKDFIFALTDRDSIEGVQHAVRIIAENPNRFEHLKFIPGIKLSFAHDAPFSKLKYENSDMLVYGINPFSQNIIDFINSTIKRRQIMSVEFIKNVKNLYPEFSYDIKEFAEQNHLKYKRDYTVSNLYWRAREYAERKGGSEVSGKLPPEQVLQEADDILDNLEKIFMGSDYKAFSAIDSEIVTDEKVNKDIEQVFNYYSTHYDANKGKVVSFAENLYKDMINTFSQEPQKPIMALSSPYYFFHYFTNNKSKLTAKTLKKVIEFFKQLQQNSNGMLVAFETVAPLYDLDTILGNDTIDKFNNYVRKYTDFYEVGGSFAKRSIP